DILAHDQNLARRGAERRRMNRAGRPVENLSRGQCLQCREQRGGCDMLWRTELGKLGQGLLDRRKPTDAAARLAGQRTPPLRKTLGVLLLEPYIDADPACTFTDVDAGDVARM